MRTLVFVPLVSSPVWAIWPFPPKRFTRNSFIDAGSLGVDGNSRIIAFGDFDGDQFLDVLSLGEDQQTLTLYVWNHADFSFHRTVSMYHQHKIVNVVPGDFRHVGKLDILVMSPGSAGVDMTLYPEPFTKTANTLEPIRVPSSTHSQPILIDVDGNLKIDMFGESSARGQGSYQLWKNVWNSSELHSQLFKMTTPNFQGSQCTLANPHSNAVVDLDGDCLADVFLVCDNDEGSRTYQIWVNKKRDGFSLSQQGLLPPGVQSISFADVDRDGTMDMVFPTCSSVSSDGVGSDCYINIAYNQQLGLCASTEFNVKKDVRTCRTPENLCVPDPDFKFDFSSDGVKQGRFVRFPLSSLFQEPTSLLVSDHSFEPALPLPIRLGDSNLDGFPDMLIITAHGRERTPSLLLSVPCSRGVVGCALDGSGKRGWKMAKKDVEALSTIKDAISASFLDLDEDGSLDVLVQRSGDTGQGKISFIQNNMYYDAFFLKAIVMNGACGNGWCYENNGTSYQPLGASHSGASYKYTVLDTSGHRSAAQVGQLPQTSYQALLTPYSFFGLGRTNNYIENLFVGTTVHSNKHYINMEGVIPNSRVVIFPSAKEEDTWRRELFLRPGEWIPWVTLTVVVGMLILAIITLILHMNEKREDEMERRRASHHINFDAL